MISITYLMIAKCNSVLFTLERQYQLQQFKDAILSLRRCVSELFQNNYYFTHK